MSGGPISRIRFDDLECIVTIHMESFQNFFLSQLGPRFLRVFYNSILKDPCGIAYMYYDQSEICGFVFGTSEPDGFYRRLLKKKWFRFASASVIPTIRNPAIIPRLLKALTKPYQFQAKPNSSLLMSIAVSKDAQRKGIGKQLVKAFLDESRRRKLSFVTLTTDGTNNDEVNCFYQNIGFNKNREFKTKEGRLMNEYIYKL